MREISNSSHNQENAGFTIVETIITTVIVTLFLIMFFQSYIIIESQRVTLAKDAAADSLAYTNLRKVTSRSTVTPCTTNASGTNLFTTTGSVYTAEPANSTTVLAIGGSSTVQQLLVAYPSSGACTGTSFDSSPIRIVSQVIYSVNGTSKEVDHASYVY